MTHATRFRAGTIADRDAILSLRAQVFAGVDREKNDPSFWEWEFQSGYAGEALLFVAESGDRLIGHVAFIPQRYVTPGGEAMGALAVDAMVHPAFHRQHVFSGLTKFAAKELRGRVGFSLALQIRKASLGGMLAGGWEVIDRLPVLIKPLSIAGIARDLGVPFPRERSKAAAGSSSAHVRPIGPEELRQFESSHASHNAQPRSDAFARWRYGARPGGAYRLQGWFADGELHAFVVHRRTILKGMRTLAIVDAGADAHHSLRLLIREVCHQYREDASLAAALVSRSHPARTALLRNGFLPGPHRFNLMIQRFDPRFEAAVTAPWELTWGDTDHL